MPTSKQGSTQKRGIASEAPGTAVKKRKSASRSSTSAHVSPSIAAANVQQYLTRFRKGSSTGGCEAAIMDDLLTVLGDGLSKREACQRLRKFIASYGVIRTFAGLREDRVDGLQPIVRHLQEHRQELLRLLAPADIVIQVEALADACKMAGFNRNLSFATKCLCMLGRPVPIFSSEGKAYLRLKGSATYGDYLAAWFVAYEDVRADYEATAARLMAESGGEPERKRGLTPAWVAMRGFDVHLMAVGGPMRS